MKNCLLALGFLATFLFTQPSWAEPASDCRDKLFREFEKGGEFGLSLTEMSWKIQTRRSFKGAICDVFSVFNDDISAVKKFLTDYSDLICEADPSNPLICLQKKRCTTDGTIGKDPKVINAAGKKECLADPGCKSVTVTDPKKNKCSIVVDCGNLSELKRVGC